MLEIPKEIIGNNATLYLKDGTIRSGRIMGFRAKMEDTVDLEFANNRRQASPGFNSEPEETEIFEASRIESIDPYCK